MLDLKLHDVETAPEGSKETLQAVTEAYGFVPNLVAYLANAPAAVKSYAAISGAFENSSLTAIEQHVVLLSVSFQNRCHYCMAAHSVTAGMASAPDDMVEALRDGRPLKDDRMEALRRFATSLTRNRGWIPEEDLQGFLDAGFTPAQVLEVLTGLCLKTLSNYMNHMAETPVDPEFEAGKWTPPEDRMASV